MSESDSQTPEKRRRPRIGLALGSGVARGWAHIGVLRELERVGVRPDVVCGTSIGALVGGAYLAGRMDELEDWAKNLSGFRILKLLDVKLGSGGLIAGVRMGKLLKRTFGGMTVPELDRPFAAVTTDLVSGHEVWLRTGGLDEAIRASYALPGVFAPVKIDGRWLVDGALVNPVPISVCRALGADLVIAVNLNTYILRRTRDSLPEGDNFDLFENLQERPGKNAKDKPGSLFKRKLFGGGNHGPSTVNVMVAALNIIQDRLSRSRLAGDPPDVHIQPRLGHIGLLEFERAEEAIEEGEAAARDALAHLSDVLAALS